MEGRRRRDVSIRRRAPNDLPRVPSPQSRSSFPLRMPSIFSRKPIAALLAEGENPHGLKRSLGAVDLVMLAIGAVIGAGIFGSIGSAAAGQVDAAGNVIRVGAGPALVLSFILLGICCALAGL